MSSDTSLISFTEKCRICLNFEKEMNPLFESIFEAEEENETMFISVADVLKSISNIKVI